MISTDSLWTSHVHPDLLVQLAADVPSDGTSRLNVRAPFTGTVIGTIPDCSEQEVHHAVDRARKEQALWNQTPGSTRRRIFLDFHDLLLARREEILDLMQIETGKTRRHALEEVLDAAITCRHYAIRAEKLLQSKRRRGAFPLLTSTREHRSPLGVVGIIAPWNYPFTLAVSDALPALLAGNAVVLKPDEHTPFTALLARDLLLKAGLPEGLFQIVTGTGGKAGEALVESADYVAFTGSTETGRKVAARAGKNLIGCSLELGGKNPMIVLADAPLDRTVEGAMQACFANAGQLCIASERIYIQRSVYEKFVTAFKKRAQSLRVGPGYDWNIEMGSLIGEEQLQKVKDHVENALALGATLLTGGRHRPDLGPYFYEPTLLADVTDAMRLFAEETFGPVVSVYPFDSEEEAIALANDSAYGLNASIWSQDIHKARILARRLRFGTVNINEAYAAAWASVDAPMGGMKDSGLGRRHGTAGLLRFTEAQTVAEQRLLPLGPGKRLGARSYDRYMSRILALVRRIPGLR